MKIRNGFVSNSSSSSFILIGKELSYSDLDFAFENKKDEYNVYALNENFWLSEGDDLINLTPDIKDVISEYGLEDEFDYYISYKEFDYEGILRKDDLPDVIDEFNIISLEVDYHNTQTIERFKERYINED